MLSRSSPPWPGTPCCSVTSDRDSLVATGAGLLVEAHGPSGRELVAVLARELEFVNVEGVVEIAQRALHEALADAVVATRAVDGRVAVVARLAAGGAEPNHLPLGFVLVRSVAGGALQLRDGEMRLMAEAASEDRPAVPLDSLVTAQAR